MTLATGVRGRKRISPQGSSFKRKSKSPRLGIDFQVMTEQKLLDSKKKIKKSEPCGSSQIFKDDVENNMQNCDDNPQLNSRDSEHTDVKQQTIATEAKDSKFSESHDLCDNNSSEDVCNTLLRTENNKSNMASEKESMRGKKESKDTKGKAKNRQRYVEVAEEKTTGPHLEDVETNSKKLITCSSTDVTKNPKNPVEEGLNCVTNNTHNQSNNICNNNTNKESNIVTSNGAIENDNKKAVGSVGNEEESSHNKQLARKTKNVFQNRTPKKISAATGLLFGKLKEPKGNRLVTKNTFSIPESQEDKSDNVFSPKRKQNSVKSKSGNDKLAHQSCKENDLPKVKITEPLERKSESGTEGLNDQNSSPSAGTSVSEGHRRNVAVSAVGNVTDSNPRPTTSAEVQNIEINAVINDLSDFKFDDSQGFDVSSHKKNSSNERETISIQENINLFKDSNNIDMLDCGGGPSGVDECSPKTNIKRDNAQGINLPDNENIDFLSESQKNDFLMTMNSEDFCSESSNGLNLNDQKYQDKDTNNIESRKCKQRSILHPNTKSSRQASDVTIDKHNPEPDNIDIIISTSEARVKACIPKRKLKDSFKNLQSKKSLFDKTVLLQEPLLEQDVNLDDLQRSARALNSELGTNTVVYEACSEDFDLESNYNLSPDRVLTDSERRKSKDRNLDGSYLECLANRRGLAKNVCVFDQISHLEAEKTSSLSVHDDEDVGRSQKVGELNKNICEIYNMELNKNTDVSISDSFLDRAFQSYFHQSCDSNEVDSNQITLPEKKKIDTSRYLQEHSSGVLISPPKREGVSTSKMNCFNDSFSQLDITPGTEALLQGEPKRNKSVFSEDNILAQGKDDNPRHPSGHTTKCRLSDDMFASPVSPDSGLPNRNQRVEDRQESNFDVLQMPTERESSAYQQDNVFPEDKADNYNQNKAGKEHFIGTSQGIKDKDIPPDTSSNSFCVIDVVNDSTLFEIFLKEWDEHDIYSVALACEKAPAQPTHGGIGKI